jgi:hypothetical protein
MTKNKEDGQVEFEDPEDLVPTQHCKKCGGPYKTLAGPDRGLCCDCLFEAFMGGML